MQEITIVIKGFVKNIQISNKRRAHYYVEGEKIPKKYSTNEYIFKRKNNKMILHKVSDGEPVIKNKNVAGTPKVERLSGNDVWNLNRISDKQAIIKARLTNYFWEVLKEIGMAYTTKIQLFPVDVIFEFNIYNDNLDSDNLDLWYRKCFLDAIKDNYDKEGNLLEIRWMPDDSKKYVRNLHTIVNDVRYEEEENLKITIKPTTAHIVDYSNLSEIIIDSTKLNK